MTSKIASIIKAIIDLLKADTTIQSLLTKDEFGVWPIYHAYISHEIQKLSLIHI